MNFIVQFNQFAIIDLNMIIFYPIFNQLIILYLMDQIGVLYTIQKFILLMYFISMHASKHNYPTIAITYINTKKL